MQEELIAPMFRIILSFILLTTTMARALTIVGYDSATNDRFSSGYPGNPVANASVSFLGAGYDLSGVGWNPADSSQSFAMISDQYFVYSNHSGPGSSLDFYSPTQGTVVSYGVSATTYQFSYNGQTSDFAVGRLTTALNPADGIANYAVLNLPTIQDYAGLHVLMYGHGVSSPVLGANVVDAYGAYDFNGDTIADNYGIGYSYHSNQPGDSMLEGGDSSSPTFAVVNGKLVLIGTHSGTTTIGGIPYSIDTFIPTYFDQMTAQGIDFTAVPEPARGLLLLLGACALLRRRHRGRRE